MKKKRVREKIRVFMVGVLLAVTVIVCTALGEELKNKVPIKLPSGPAGPGRFGAYYMTMGDISLSFGAAPVTFPAG
jgi:hypothetical protein